MSSPWIATFTGKRFTPLDPRVEDVDIRDIAHALSMKCRFGGHCAAFYSVAEHSVLVSWLVPPEHRLAALLHDAAEAYLADIPRPVKPALPGWAEVEDRVEQAIAERFSVAWPWAPEIKAADTAMVMLEGERIMAAGTADWDIDAAPAEQTVRLWPAWHAEKVFLNEFGRLTGDGW